MAASPRPRTHTKSRNGCKTCRRRKVKCDEKAPLCANCARRGIQCEWTDPADLPISRRSRQVPTFPTIISSSNLNLQAIELIHQWTTSTCYTLCTDRVTLDVWKITIPRVAVLLDNAVLLHAILAFSALHLFTLNPTGTFAVQYSCAAVSHYNSAIATLPSADQLCKEDGTTFIAQLLISVYGFATSPSVPVSGEWLRILRGTAETFKNPFSRLESTVVAGLIPWVASHQHHVDFWDVGSSLTTMLETLPLPINGTPEIDEVRDAATSASYQHAVHVLQKAVVASRQPEFQLHAALYWFALSSESFMELLLARNARALVLLAHYFGMMKRMGGPWWARKDWDFELTRIASVLGNRWDMWLNWEVLFQMKSLV